MINYSERAYWSAQVDESLGKWRVISKAKLRLAFIVFCVVTPCTNWLLFLLPKVREVKY